MYHSSWLCMFRMKRFLPSSGKKLEVLLSYATLVNVKLNGVPAAPQQAWPGSRGSRNLSLPDFLDNRHIKVARLSAPHTGRLNPPRDVRGAHLFSRLSRN
jgi:hypothetical protein